MNVKIELSHTELQIMLQCINSLNFEGKHVVAVGMLANKLQQELTKLEQKVKANEQSK